MGLNCADNLQCNSDMDDDDDDKGDNNDNVAVDVGLETNGEVGGFGPCWLSAR